MQNLVPFNHDFFAKSRNLCPAKNICSTISDKKELERYEKGSVPFFEGKTWSGAGLGLVYTSDGSDEATEAES